MGASPLRPRNLEVVEARCPGVKYEGREHQRRACRTAQRATDARKIEREVEGAVGRSFA
jgi:hypothetical protein